MLISFCCSARIIENTESGDYEDGVCSKCYEHSSYYDDEGLEDCVYNVDGTCHCSRSEWSHDYCGGCKDNYKKMGD